MVISGVGVTLEVAGETQAQFPRPSAHLLEAVAHEQQEKTGRAKALRRHPLSFVHSFNYDHFEL